MTLLRRYIWVIVIIGMIFCSLVVSLIFLIINKCISRKGKHRILRLQERSDTNIESNKYHERNLDSSGPAPSLPPRTQFLTADTPGFEQADDEHDYEQMPDCEQSTDQQPDYVKMEEETKTMSPSSLCNHPNPHKGDPASLGQSYENLAGENDYEECMDQQPDYVKVEEETSLLPPPPAFYNDPSPQIKLDASLGQSYENLAEENDYEESTDQQPDYVTADDEAEIFPPPPPPPFSNDPDMKSDGSLAQSYENLAGEHDYEESTDLQPEKEAADPAADDSSEDYDDIRSENEEDYDDIGSENEEDYDDIGSENEEDYDDIA
ncbi:GRIP and coiled-coil domain-containing protein PFC0235w-like [Kryptolebias marmoratus]|uniref:GRIP and coiled-coil domain-containing protein PFC0235w-like n=1 Tax=Kryptolebias marmoratus TaxID=37003 RepID=UPI0007F923C6|nr:GRIP and coiled-coil domain-containing protein PFC0235w-like [Kryptolebias marmoratus]XP_017284646.1 GRIP and coiled-coil domain-containing protein PFC0235w-like [Kryptolebias marmoratus]